MAPRWPKGNTPCRINSLFWHFYVVSVGAVNICQGDETGEDPKSIQSPKFRQGFPAREDKHTKPKDQHQFGLYIFAQELLYRRGWENLKFHS